MGSQNYLVHCVDPIGVASHDPVGEDFRRIRSGVSGRVVLAAVPVAAPAHLGRHQGGHLQERLEGGGGEVSGAAWW